MPGTLEELQGAHCVWKGLCDEGILENKVGGRALAEKEEVPLEDSEKREANP